MIMNVLVADKVDEQFSYLQQAIVINKVLKEKYRKEEEEQNEALSKLQLEYQQLQARIAELESKKCKSCEVLQQNLAEQRRLNRNANSRLKSIASLLSTDEKGQTSSSMNEQWFRVTQILEDSKRVDQDKKRKFSLLRPNEEEQLQTDKKINSKIIVPETMNICETQLQTHGIVVPETQVDLENVSDSKTGNYNEDNFSSNLIGSLVPQDNTFLETVEAKVERLRAERQVRSPMGEHKQTRLDKLKNKPSIQTNHNKSEINKPIPEKSAAVSAKLAGTQKQTQVDQMRNKFSGSSAISEEMHDCNIPTTLKKDCSFYTAFKNTKPVSLRNSIETDVAKESYWKLKPSLLIKSDNGGKGCCKRKKNLKQTTLSVGSVSVEKKHDISILETFNGGIANSYQEDAGEDSDVVFDSPKKIKAKKEKLSTRRRLTNKGIKDLDETLFQPQVTSTCLPETAINLDSAVLTMMLGTKDMDETLFQPPVTSTYIPTLPGDSSYDRLPEASKSPTYKYKRAPVRKKEERIKLPGWSCDECAKYYEVAGQSWSREEVQERMNACSRHREKYQIRAKTPPGFWDPVIPSS